LIHQFDNFRDGTVSSLAKPTEMKVHIVHTAEYGCKSVPDIIAWLRRFTGPLRLLSLDCHSQAGASAENLKAADSSLNGSPAISFDWLDILRREKRIGNNV
jgi:hypothetical protein